MLVEQDSSTGLPCSDGDPSIDTRIMYQAVDERQLRRDCHPIRYGGHLTSDVWAISARRLPPESRLKRYQAGGTYESPRRSAAG